MSTQLQRQIMTCTGCKLCMNCQGPVPYSGRPSPLMIIGEAPGRQEDDQGKPFVGPSGEMLWDCLRQYGLQRKHFLVANAVSCFPHGTPTASELYACRGNLLAQIRRCSPSLILALGKSANWVLRMEATEHVKNLDKAPPSIKAIRGEWYRFLWFKNSAGETIDVFPVLHPSAIMRDRSLMRGWQSDISDFCDYARGYTGG